MEIQTIKTDAAPLPAGHYSQAKVWQGVAYVAGQLPIDPLTGRKEVGTIEEQTAQVLRNIEAVLSAAGSNLSKILRVTVYISDIELWGRVNQVYSNFMGDNRPARTVVPVNQLHYGFQIEMDVIAAV
ncbi:MAG: RidA family protein [Blastocatellia bacterium]|jgi:2-iminobutanoate/2-iminopropanoate deaminase